MDGVFNDSPWPCITQTIDGADRILRISPTLLFAFAFITVYYILLGGWLDLLLTATLIGLRNRDIIETFGRCTWKILHGALIPAFCAIGVSFVVISTFAKNDINWKGPGRPYLIPCKTTHARRFPKKHSFGYSYLVVGVPVGSTDNVNGMLTIDDGASGSWLSRLFRHGWYNVSASDYMQRGHNAQGLRGKLDEYLISQGVEPSDFPHAYLVTAARFLGYHFNPVSFWYLYSADKVLCAIVLEVNNTFGEKRPYLVLRDFSSDANHITGPQFESTAPCRVKGSWSKDFHVSPFNSRKGAYSLLASDPFGPGMEGFRGIDVTINLSSSKGHAKLVARLFSQGEAIDPASMGRVAKAKFLSRWFWVGFATFPRIAKEAAALFFTRRLHVWFRPEPLKDSLGRHATTTERELEAAFRKYLESLVNQCRKPLSVRYVSSGISTNPEMTFTSSSWYEASKDQVTMELKVLTPIFYTRFAHYAHDLEAMFTEFTDSATVWVSEPRLLPDLFLKKGSPPLQSASMADFLFFKSIQNLRRRPAKIPRVSTSADSPKDEPTVVDIRDFRISSMDAYILEFADQDLKATYRSTLLRMFVADRYTLGQVAFLDLGIFCLRLGIAWVFVAALKLAAT